MKQDDSAIKASRPPPECCMCGDYGVSNKLLIQCRVCQFRSQHSYCSNLYPRAESYQVCNWCLSQKEDKDKSKHSSNCSSSNKTNGHEDYRKKKNDENNNREVVKSLRSNLQLRQQQQQLNKPIKKLRVSLERSLPPPPPLPTTGTRIIETGAIEEKKLLKRTKSELEILNNNSENTVMIRKPFFRNKVRRYKLLDEV